MEADAAAHKTAELQAQLAAARRQADAADELQSPVVELEAQLEAAAEAQAAAEAAAEAAAAVPEAAGTNNASGGGGADAEQQQLHDQVSALQEAAAAGAAEAHEEGAPALQSLQVKLRSRLYVCTPSCTVSWDAGGGGGGRSRNPHQSPSRTHCTVAAA